MGTVLPWRGSTCLLLSQCLVLVLIAGAWFPTSRGDLLQQTKLRIDCGSSSPTTLTTAGGQQTFEPDGNYVSAGNTATILNAADHGLNSVEASLRFFPSDVTTCHVVSVWPGRYLVRLGFAYYNYDGLNQPPRFRVLVQDTLVETVDMATISAQLSSGAYYSDYIVFAKTGNLSLCLQPRLPLNNPASVPSPIINSFEILPTDVSAYDAARTGGDVVLSTFLRLNMGGGAVGPEPQDPGFRTWEGENETRTGGQAEYKVLSTDLAIKDTGGAPDYLPQSVFQTCREAVAGSKPANATGFAMTLVLVHPSNQWYLRYYLAEIDPDVLPGERQFHLVLGSGSAAATIGDASKPFDILGNARGILSGLVVPVFFNFSERHGTYGQDVEIGVRTAVGSQRQAVLCGVELYEVIPQGWNGDENGAAVVIIPPSRGALNTGEIAAIVVGVVGTAAMLAAIAIYILRRRSATSFVPIVEADMHGSPSHGF